MVSSLSLHSVRALSLRLDSLDAQFSASERLRMLAQTIAAKASFFAAATDRVLPEVNAHHLP